MLSSEELDIVGDIDENGEPSDVTIFCQGFYRQCHFCERFLVSHICAF